MALSKDILNCEGAMNELSKMYADMYFAHMKDNAMVDEMMYFLEQECGVCRRPSAIRQALYQIWDKIQEGAQKYGYNGPITTKTKEEEQLPDRLKEIADMVLESDALMEDLVLRYEASKKPNQGLVNGAFWKESYFYSIPNGILRYAPELGLGTITFNEAKMIVKYIMDEIKEQYKAKKRAEKEESKNIGESIYRKNTVRINENQLKRIVMESVKRVLKEDGKPWHVLKVEYDEQLSHSRGRNYFYCNDNGRYYTKVDGEWFICTDNYSLEPDCHLEDGVKVEIV